MDRNESMANEPQTPDTPLLTRDEAAKYLRISVRTLWALTRRGKIPVVTLSERRIAYIREDLDRHIAESRTVGLNQP